MLACLLAGHPANATRAGEQRRLVGLDSLAVLLDEFAVLAREPDALARLDDRLDGVVGVRVRVGDGVGVVRPASTPSTP